VRKGNKRGTAYAYNVKALRDAEIELARYAEEAYQRFVSQCSAAAQRSSAQAPQLRSGVEGCAARPSSSSLALCPAVARASRGYQTHQIAS
jgi:hypothetical protein